MMKTGRTEPVNMSSNRKPFLMGMEEKGARPVPDRARHR